MNHSPMIYECLSSLTNMPFIRKIDEASIIKKF